jgi:hypothetical protein
MACSIVPGWISTTAACASIRPLVLTASSYSSVRQVSTSGYWSVTALSIATMAAGRKASAISSRPSSTGMTRLPSTSRVAVSAP